MSRVATARLAALAAAAFAVALAASPAWADGPSPQEEASSRSEAALPAQSGQKAERFALSGSVSYSALAAWSDDGSPSAADLGFGSVARAELGLDIKRPGVRASARGYVDAASGSAAALGGLSWELDRAYLKWSPGPLVATVGRQVVNWGAALLWSPADLFAETELVGLSPERQGIDAIRLAVPVGSLGGVEVVAEPAAQLSAGRYGARAYGYALGADFGLEAAWDGYEEEFAVAANVKADLILGVWAEASLTAGAGQAFSLDGLVATVGADWSAGKSFVAAAEYRYKALGATTPAEAVAAALEGEAFPGVHNAYASANLALGDLASLGFSVLADLGNGIYSPALSLAIDAAQDLSLSAWLRYASGSFASLGEADSASIGAVLELAF